MRGKCFIQMEWLWRKNGNVLRARRKAYNGSLIMRMDQNYETNIQVEAEGNYTLNFGVIDSAACVANQENLKITYDCHKPEIIYTGVDNESGDLIFKAEENGDDKKKNTLYVS